MSNLTIVLATLVQGALGSADVEVNLSPLNGTNLLLRGEVPYVVLGYKNVSKHSVDIGDAHETTQVRASGGEWRVCEDRIHVSASRIGAPSRSPLMLSPGETRRFHHSLEDRCPGITSTVGTFEVRMDSDVTTVGVISMGQHFVVVEPEGLDAEALRTLKTGRVGARADFLKKYAGTPYAAPFVLSRHVSAKPLGLQTWAAGMRQEEGDERLRLRSQVLQAFLARNPAHLFADDARRDLIAVSGALGDAQTLEKAVKDLEARDPESADAKEARGMLAGLKRTPEQ
jgi:hypothetical protein